MLGIIISLPILLNVVNITLKTRTICYFCKINLARKIYMSSETTTIQQKASEKSLYDYQIKDLNRIFDVMREEPDNFNLLYQLPTGGGKTVIFSEIVRRFIEQHNKKVVILTHRVELCKQTSDVLSGFNVKNKVINSKVKTLPDQDDYQCFVAMVETLNNRLSDKDFELKNVGLVIIDEAHYNSFRKLFKFFDQCLLSFCALKTVRNVSWRLMIATTAFCAISTSKWPSTLSFPGILYSALGP